MSDWDMKFPIVYLMVELVLCVPIHTTKFGVQFYESIIADGFVAIILGDRITIGLKKLIAEAVWKGHFGLRFLLIWRFG